MWFITSDFFLRRKIQRRFFEHPPSPSTLKRLHLSLYPLSSGEGKNSGLQKPQTFACFGIAGRRDGFLIPRGMRAKRRLKVEG
jgi:hypothetical protein